MLNVVRCTAPSAQFEFGGSVRWRQDSGLGVPLLLLTAGFACWPVASHSLHMTLLACWGAVNRASTQGAYDWSHTKGQCTPRVNALNMKIMAARQRARHLVRFQQLQADRTLNRRRAAAALKRVRGQLRENFCRHHPRLRHDVVLVER